MNRNNAKRWLFWLVLLFGCVNGVLYTLLLPLWEGFDEAFHYAYVQDLSARGELPILGKSSLSREVWDSLHFAPVSYLVRRGLPESRTFEEYFALPDAQRREIRKELREIPPAEQYDTGVLHVNYEAHQTPLAYLILAIPDRLLSGRSLPARVAVSRLICVLTAVFLTAGAAAALCRQLTVLSPYRESALFLTFSSQMFYATTAHVCNDWLAVPLASWLIVAAIRLQQEPPKAASALGIVLALGLLTKAYFIAFVPLIVGMVLLAAARRRLKPLAAAAALLIPVALAGPWYARNLRLYGALSAMPEAIAGIGIGKVLRAAPGVPWATSIPYMARASLWTGNNHFNTFSRATLDLMLALLFAGGYCYAFHRWRRGFTAADRVLLSAILMFSLAVAYSTVLSFVYTRGASAGASPWYMQALLLPVAALAMSGGSRFLAGANVLLWAYVGAATYVVKLLPQYGGYDHVAGLLDWYLHGGIQRNEILAATALAPPHVLYALIGLTGGMAVLIAASLCKSLFRARA